MSNPFTDAVIDMQYPVRVCFVIENLLPAGTELWIVRLIERLDRRRVEPYLCLLDGENEESRGLEPQNCTVLRLGMTRILGKHGIRSAKTLYRFLKQHQIEIVQTHHADPTYFAAPIAKLARVGKILQTKYDVGFWLTSKHRWLHRLYRVLVDMTVANCEACRDAATEQEWSPRHKVTVVDNGIPLEQLLAIPKLDLQQDGSINVGMVSNLRPVKNPQLLVESAVRVLKSHPNVVFHIAGNGPLLDSLRLQIDELGLSDRFRLYGAVANIPEFLAGIEIAVLCSNSEGLSHAVLEYMAAGRAIIATDVGGNAEIISHEQTGLLVPADDVTQLTNAIHRYIDEPYFANKLGRNARDYVANRYSLDAMTERFESFYQGLLPRSGNCSSPATSTSHSTSHEHAT